MVWEELEENELESKHSLSLNTTSSVHTYALASGPHPQLWSQVQIPSPQPPATQSKEVQTAFTEPPPGKMRGLGAGPDLPTWQCLLGQEARPVMGTGVWWGNGWD